MGLNCAQIAKSWNAIVNVVDPGPKKEKPSSYVIQNPHFALVIHFSLEIEKILSKCDESARAHFAKGYWTPGYEDNRKELVEAAWGHFIATACELREALAKAKTTKDIKSAILSANRRCQFVKETVEKELGAMGRMLALYHNYDGKPVEVSMLRL